MPIQQKQEHQKSAGVIHSRTQRLTLTLSGLKIVVEVPKEATKDLLQEFSYFMTLGECREGYDFFVKVDYESNLEKALAAPITLASSAIAAMGIGGREPTLLSIDRKDSKVVRFTSPWLEGEFDGNKNVEMRACYPDPAFAVKAALTNVMSDLLLKHDRFFMHSSGVLHRDKAFLFSGKSGAGKTTVVWQSDGRTIFSDELVILSAEKDGSFVAHGTPYFGSWGQIGADVRAPLHCVHFLSKKPFNQIDSLPPKLAFRYMCQVICFLSPNTAVSHKLLHFAGQLVPYARLLSFKPTKELWPFLSTPDLFEKGLTHDFL